MAQFSYLVGFVGSDVGRSLGVELHEREARRHGLRYLCRRVDADGRAFRDTGMSGLLQACRDFGFSGLGVAHPYCHFIVPYVDELSESATRSRAVNVIVFAQDGRAVGHNTDVAGCVDALVRGLPGVPLGRVVQIGAGAAGIAAAHALHQQGAERLSVMDPAADRARALAETLNQCAGHDWVEAFPAEALASQLRQADGLVNTLPSGGTGCQDASLSEALHKDLWIFDAHHHPVHSPLLRAGSTLGCQILDGGGVLVNEVAAAFRLVTGLTPHTSHMFGDFADLMAGPQAHT